MPAVVRPFLLVKNKTSNQITVFTRTGLMWAGFRRDRLFQSWTGRPPCQQPARCQYPPKIYGHQVRKQIREEGPAPRPTPWGQWAGQCRAGEVPSCTSVWGDGVLELCLFATLPVLAAKVTAQGPCLLFGEWASVCLHHWAPSPWSTRGCSVHGLNTW